MSTGSGTAYLLGLKTDLEVQIKQLLSADFRTECISSSSLLSSCTPSEEHTLVLMSEKFVSESEDLQELMSLQFPVSTRVLILGSQNTPLFRSFPPDFFDRVLIKAEDPGLLPREIFEIRRLFDLKSSVLNLEVLASSDPLTGLRNKRYFEERLSAELERARRYERDLSLILMDIDGLKKVNDHKGHLEGDEVLIHLARLLRQTVRSTDLISRWAGDEFTVLLTETALDGAKVVAERLRQLVESDRFFQDLGVTLSLGLADFPNRAKTKEELKKICDQSLIQAKNRGRNRIFYPGAA